MNVRAATLRRFKTYPAYKDSGVEWLGKIPAHWRALPLKRIGELQAGAGFPEDEQGIQDEELPFFKVGDMGMRGNEREMVVQQHSVSRTTARRLGAYVFPPGTILFAKVGAALLLNRRRMVVQPTCIDNNMMGFMPYDCDANWALCWLTGLDMGRLANPGAVPSVNEGQIRETPAAVPSPPEQRAIAAFLGRETARIDALVAKKERLTELLREQRTALITRVVTKGLDPTTPMKDSGVEWLGEIPAHWEVKRLRHLVARIEQGWSPECENREADDDEWGVLKAGCVNRGIFFESEHKALPATLLPIASLEISEGDLLMSRASGSRELVGSVAVVPKCRPRLLLCDKVFRIHPLVECADRFFLAYAMNSTISRWQIEVVLSGGSGLANNIAQEVVKDLLFAQPWLPEQRAIVAFLDRETARIDALVAKVREAIDRLKEFRNALISAAVTGRIDVREVVA